MILEALSIDDIRTRCPRFNEWMTKLEEGIRNDYYEPFSTCMVENDLWGMFRL